MYILYPTLTALASVLEATESTPEKNAACFVTARKSGEGAGEGVKNSDVHFLSCTAMNNYMTVVCTRGKSLLELWQCRQVAPDAPGNTSKIQRN